jgi:hypothetical protein
MCISVHSNFLVHDDRDAFLGPDRDPVGFEVGNDVGDGGLREVAAQGAPTALLPVADLATAEEVRNG